MPNPGYKKGESWKSGSAGKRERMVVYVDWLLTPLDEQKPSTKTELAALLGVSTNTLRNYAQDAWLQREVAERARAEAKIERLPAILASLYSQALDETNPRSVSAARTYIEFLKNTEDVRELESLEDMSNDDLVNVVNELLARQAKATTND